MNDHGLSDWTFRWDRAVRRAGLTRHRDRVISLSTPLMRQFPRDEATNTILHEIAHALVGPTHGHGKVWKAKAAEIGARPERCYDSSIARVEGDWTGECPVGHTRDLHRAPKNLRVSCGTCSPRRFDETYLLSWRWRGTPILEPGTTVDLRGDHAWTGHGGSITHVKGTRYVVRFSDGTALRVPFRLAAPVDGERTP
ncbi:SprT-like domain-containing protein [Isoptericola sediminis]